MSSGTAGFPTVAIAYDFDGTLAKGNVQEHGLLRLFGLSKADFWSEVKARAEARNADEILTYMTLILEHAQKRAVKITRESLESLGMDVPLFKGVTEWFSDVNELARQHHLNLKHYVISSGTEEIIRGTPIAHCFENIFGCTYVYDEETGEARWPATAINYTTKTQYLFRINKGISNHWDNTTINRWVPLDERPVPFGRIIFIGDGDTDIPAMKMVAHQGGHSIAVFDPDEWPSEKTQTKVHNLISENRAHFVTPADYSRASQLYVTVRGLLGRIARETKRSG